MKKKLLARKTKTLEPGLQRIEALCHLMSQNKISELEWEKSGERIRLRVGSEPVAIASAPIPSVAPAVTSAPLSAAPTAPKESPAPANQKQITSPFVGTFYRAPSPTSEPYVREGQVVKRGDTLCIIEAMKLMNEIESELSGRILSILAENGQPVEFGEPLFLMEVSG